jgi:fumarate reductase flavoprotein subunit
MKLHTKPFPNGILLFVLPFIMIIGGCDTTTGPEPESGVFKAGTYTAETQGARGAVAVSVLFTANTIKNVTIIQHKESVDRDDVAIAIARIPSNIHLQQTLSIDAVTGATLTSKAILAAVEDCVKQAGGDEAVAALKK